LIEISDGAIFIGAFIEIIYFEEIDSVEEVYPLMACFCVPTEDDQIIIRLQNIITANKLLVDYEIK